MKKEFILSVVVSFTFLSLGFLLLHYELIGYGLSFFVFLPFILGYILGRRTIRIISLVGLIFSLVIFFLLLLAGELEGMVCILMALPLVIGAIILGAIVKYFYEKGQNKDKPDNIIKGSILPLFLFLALAFIEKELTKNDKEVISVKTEMIFPYSTTEVYETIKSVDTLIADKPFLMKLDLPIPNKCILEKEEVGGLRTCYFSGGTITERITELEKAKILRMDVIDYKLTGRKWLGFKEAIYYFDNVGQDTCKLTRITTYTSVLTPRIYWRPLEKIGISQEHDYVFDNLRNDLKKKYSR
ncbi:MAG TPA: polyketide cyclase [Chitinophagales bacterium]|nr:polyketide cyclase [Chitinophagales bacterium]